MELAIAAVAAAVLPAAASSSSAAAAAVVAVVVAGDVEWRTRQPPPPDYEFELIEPGSVKTQLAVSLTRFRSKWTTPIGRLFHLCSTNCSVAAVQVPLRSRHFNYTTVNGFMNILCDIK